jgi:hypothetical protein
MMNLPQTVFRVCQQQIYASMYMLFHQYIMPYKLMNQY